MELTHRVDRGRNDGKAAGAILLPIGSDAVNQEVGSRFLSAVHLDRIGRGGFAAVTDDTRRQGDQCLQRTPTCHSQRQVLHLQRLDGGADVR